MTTLKLEHNPLPLSHNRFNICEWEDDNGVRCGDEVPVGTPLCPAHQRAEDRIVNEQGWARENVEPLISFPHLTD